ncbi:MAG: alkaline phosphatase family protein, partial [Nitriliruptorales bacterium]|nr:alkaline phosphatase family protein [Nitriliruptorales bacterium]
ANRADWAEDYAQLGFRVPTVVASPFARRGFVAHPTYDHTSILKMIEWRFGLAPLTVRDAAARNMAETFDWDNPDTSIPDTFSPYTANIVTGPICPGGQPLFPETIEIPGFGTAAADASGLTLAQAQAAGHRPFAANPRRDHDLSRLFESGWIERLGYRLPFETGNEVPTKIRRYA